MPRSISDYPDAFARWNLVSTFGSLISVVATFIFLDVLYKQLTTGKESSRYPWLTPQFYSDILRALLDRAYDSLEWGLNSPPRPHSFVSLPIQSMPVLPLDILMIVGPYIEYESFEELTDIIANIFIRMNDIAYDYQYSFWEGLNNYTRSLENIELSKRNFLSEESLNRLDLLRDDIHKLAKNERHLRTLQIESYDNLFITNYYYEDKEFGFTRVHNVTDMIRFHEFWVAEANKMVLKELPFPQS